MKKFLLVDCFDTIIYRKVPAEKIKYIWAQQLADKYRGLSNTDFYRLIKSIENEFVGLKQEWTLLQMCEKMQEYISSYKLINDLNSDFIKDAINLYHKTEIDNQYINTKVLKFLKEQKGCGLKIYIVSDFYCGKESLKLFFDNLGIGDLIDGYFVSCDLNLSKSKGDIYKFVLNDLGAITEEVVMMGDNKISDYINPSQLGIDCKRVLSNNRKFKLRFKEDKIKIPKYLKAIYNLDKGFSNYSFSLFLFIKKLANALKTNNKTEVFFLSREGEFLKKLFEYYCDLRGLNIKSHYLEMSRNSIMIAGLKDLEHETFDLLIAEKGSISINEFLKSLEFEDSVIKEIKLQTNIDFDAIIDDFATSNLIKVLFNNPKFIFEYDTNRLTQKELFKQYLHQFNVDYNSNGMSIVDVGWKGTMQDFLFKYLEGQVEIDGYYLGLTSARNISFNNKKHGLLYSCAPLAPTELEKKFLCQIYSYEQILRASHNRVVGYKKKEEKVVSVYDQRVDDKQFYESHIKNLQDRIFEKFKILCKYANEEKDCVFTQLHFKMILQTSYRDYMWLQECLNKHFDSFAKSEYVYELKGTKINYIKHRIRNLKFAIKMFLNLV